MKKPAIPSIHTGRPDVDLAHSSVKETLDQITGQARGVDKLEPLPGTASLVDVIVRLNAIADRLQ